MDAADCSTFTAYVSQFIKKSVHDLQSYQMDLVDLQGYASKCRDETSECPNVVD